MPAADEATKVKTGTESAPNEAQAGPSPSTPTAEHTVTSAFLKELETVFLSEELDRAKLFAIREKIFQDIDLADRLEGLTLELESAVAKAEKPSARRAYQVKLGFAHWILEDYSGAISVLESVVQEITAHYFMGLIFLERGNYTKALAALERAAEKDDSLEVTCALLETRTRLGLPAESLKQADKMIKGHPESSEAHYQRGLALDHLGEYEAAIKSYQEALELNASHIKSSFRLGYLLALRGQEEEALHYYQKCVNTPPAYASVLLNLGLLYEDARQYEKAVSCYQKVLRSDPTNDRARVFLKDALASLHMYYDEDQQTEMNRRKSLLKMPVAEFELSVRCRSALESIGIQAVGDLVTKTDQELLACDNFGETSLQEIKILLAQHGLHLGMSMHDVSSESKAVLGRPGDQTVLDKLVNEVDLSVRSRRCMERLGIVTLRDLTEKTEKELLSGKNFGRTSLKEIKDKLAQFGMKLAEDNP